MAVPQVRVSFDAQDFTNLVRGGVVQRQVETTTGQPVLVMIALQDIGYSLMQRILNEAERDYRQRAQAS